MINNNLLKEGHDILLGTAFRRIYGLSLILLCVVFFIVLPVSGPGGGTAIGGPPLIFVSMAVASVVITLSAYVVCLNLLTGRSTEADQWLLHSSPAAYFIGKSSVNIIFSIIYGILPLPFLTLAAHFEALPIPGAPAVSVYLTGILVSYAFLLGVSELFISGRQVIRRIILWIVYFFHLLMTRRLAPFFNPFRELSELNLSLNPDRIHPTGLFLASIKTGWFPLIFLLPLFLILTFLKSRRRTDE